MGRMRVREVTTRTTEPADACRPGPADRQFSSFYSLQSVGLPERPVKDAPPAVTYHTALFIETGRRKSDPFPDAGGHANERRTIDLREHLEHLFHEAARHARFAQPCLPLRGWPRAQSL